MNMTSKIKKNWEVLFTDFQNGGDFQNGVDFQNGGDFQNG
jgi:hypothetical protein